MFYYRARYYDQSTGRFIQQDPINLGGGTTNLYEYVKNNPVYLTDPTGELPPVIVMGLAGAVIGAASTAISDVMFSETHTTSWTHVAIGAITGGIMGAAAPIVGAEVAGATAQAVAMGIVGGVASAIQYAATTPSNEFTWGGLAASATFGGLAAAVVPYEAPALHQNPYVDAPVQVVLSQNYKGLTSSLVPVTASSASVIVSRYCNKNGG
jgi:uncharacterized protein RhaS with RHS repeats